MIRVVETGHVESPVAALDLLTSEHGAESFRDIKKYTRYHQDVDGTISASYPSGIPFAGDVVLTVRPQGKVVAFAGGGPLNAAFSGTWTIERNGSVVLEQVVHAPRWAMPLVKRRVRRAMQDLEDAARQRGNIFKELFSFKASQR